MVLGSACVCSAVECSIVEWCMQWCGVVQWNSAVHAVVWCIQWSSAVYTCSDVVHTVVWCCAVVSGAGQ
jgi:hypothetical protein